MTTQVAETTKTVNPFNAIADQEIKSIAHMHCVYVIGAVEDYEVDGNKGKTGFIQVLQLQRPDSKRLRLVTIKVREEERPLIDLLNKQAQNKPVVLQVEVAEIRGKMQRFLTADQPKIKLKPAA
jgi:hypothetical protein